MNNQGSKTQTKHVPLFDTTDKMYNLEEIITILKKNNCNESIIKMIKPDIIQPKEMECLYLSKTKNKANESTKSFLGKKRENENILNEKEEKEEKEEKGGDDDMDLFGEETEEEKKAKEEMKKKNKDKKKDKKKPINKSTKSKYSKESKK